MAASWASISALSEAVAWAHSTRRMMPLMAMSLCPAAFAAATRSQSFTVPGAAGSWLHAPEVSVGDCVGRTADFAEAAAVRAASGNGNFTLL